MQNFFNSMKELGTLMNLHKNMYDTFFLYFKIKFLFYISFFTFRKNEHFLCQHVSFLEKFHKCKSGSFIS